MKKVIPTVLVELAGLPAASMTNIGSNSEPNWAVSCSKASAGDLVAVTLKKSRSLKIVRLVKELNIGTWSHVQVYPIVKE